jgi:SAM-dependent methyltransferase
VRGPLTTQPASGRAYFRSYLRFAPLSLALWRAAEARAIASAPLPRPLLDVGCGFGEFGRVFFEEPADVGLDVSRSDLRLNLAHNPYRSLVQADGCRLPFRDAAFASVLSVSVVEHIPNADEVLPEAWRVLRPGGVFVFTTPSPKMREMLLYSRLANAVRLGALGRAYAGMVDRFLRHISVQPAEHWVAALERAGFHVREQRETIPLRLLAAFDLSLPAALPSQIGRLMRRDRWVWRPPGAVALLDRLFGGLVDEDLEVGCNLFFVAEKP